MPAPSAAPSTAFRCAAVIAESSTTRITPATTSVSGTITAITSATVSRSAYAFVSSNTRPRSNGTANSAALRQIVDVFNSQYALGTRNGTASAYASSTVPHATCAGHRHDAGSGVNSCATTTLPVTVASIQNGARSSPNPRSIAIEAAPVARLAAPHAAAIPPSVSASRCGAGFPRHASTASARGTNGSTRLVSATIARIAAAGSVADASASNTPHNGGTAAMTCSARYDRPRGNAPARSSSSPPSTVATPRATSFGCTTGPPLRGTSASPSPSTTRYTDRTKRVPPASTRRVPNLAATSLVRQEDSKDVTLPGPRRDPSPQEIRSESSAPPCPHSYSAVSDARSRSRSAVTAHGCTKLAPPPTMLSTPV